MLSFRRETEYAIQFLRTLSRAKKDISLNDVSRQIGVSFLFVQKIVRKERAARLVAAAKGASGGYRLLVSPKKLSLRKIISITEEECELLPCCCADFKCTKGKGCALKGRVSKVNVELLKMLDKVKLSDL